MDLIDVMTELYRSEINCGVQTFWDGGVEVWLGDSLNGCRVNRSFGIGDMNLAACWLDKKVRDLYPGSDYATGRIKEEAKCRNRVRAKAARSTSTGASLR